MAASEDVLQDMKGNNFFQGLPDSDLEHFAPCVSFKSFEPGQVIIRDGDPADCFHILRLGTVAIELTVPPRGRLPLQTLGAGDILGWSWAVPPYRWSFDARATALVRTLAVDAILLRDHCNTDPAFGYRLMQRIIRVMAGRITAARLQMLDLYGPALVSRL